MRIDPRIDPALKPRNEEMEFRAAVKKPVEDFSYMVGAAIWTLEEGLNLLV